jgi:hypothetical protein
MSNHETELHDFPNIFSLKGKVIVVTGGSRGLGLHAASGYGQVFSFLGKPKLIQLYLQISSSRRFKGLYNITQSSRM